MASFHPYQEYSFQNQPYASASSSSPEPAVQTKTNKVNKLGKWSKESSGGPVKNACLSCRTKKAKCDGVQPICGQCDKKDLECIFVKSKRGGARKKREPVPPPSALAEFLKKLDGLLKVPEYNLSPVIGDSSLSDDTRTIVRIFTSREEILRCYYTEVHPFLTVLPPRHYLADILPTLLPESPFLLAAQTIMTLMPHGQDPNPSSNQSRRLRQAASEALGEQTLQSINRNLVHGISIESVQALVMLSLWEWGNSGSLERSRQRSGRALQLAMELGLHEIDKGNEHDARSTFGVSTGRAIEGVDWRRDMARRTWWTVYINQLTAALVSGHEAVLGPDDPRVKVDFPICSVADQSWPRWINTTRQCSRAFAMVNSLMYSHYGSAQHSFGTHASGVVAEQEKQKLQIQVMQLDRTVVELMKEAEQMSIISLVPGGEEEVCRNQQISARFGIAVTHIHIHRHQAFPEVSLFSKKICGLPKAPEYVPPLAEIGTSSNPPYQPTHPQPTNQYYYDESVDPLTQVNPHLNGVHTSSGETLSSGPDFDFIEDLWQPESFPSHLPLPWFAQPNGAASLYRPTFTEPIHAPALDRVLNTIPSIASDVSNALAGSYIPVSSGMTGGESAYLSAIDSTPPLSERNSRTPPMVSSVSTSTNNSIWTPQTIGSDMSTYPSSNGHVNVNGTINGNCTGRSTSLSSSVASAKPHKAWGVDISSNASPTIPSSSTSSKLLSPLGKDIREGSNGFSDGNGNGDEVASRDDDTETDLFPPGISLARCATAAHTIVRLEVLHHSASIALANGPPKWLPFCACALVSGAYAFLLLALAVQAENAFGSYTQSQTEEVEALLTNVKIILAGLEAYGSLWAGIDVMAGEVRAALEAATRLPMEVQEQTQLRYDSGSPEEDEIM